MERPALIARKQEVRRQLEQAQRTLAHVQAQRCVFTAQLFPVGDPAQEDILQLLQGDVREGIVWVDDDRQGVPGHGHQGRVLF